MVPRKHGSLAVIRRVGGLEVWPAGPQWLRQVIRRVGGLEVISKLQRFGQRVIRRVGGLEEK